MCHVTSSDDRCHRCRRHGDRRDGYLQYPQTLSAQTTTITVIITN